MTTTNATVTIRTSTGQLFGEFANREDAWAAVERVRKAGHDTMYGAAVVPLLAGVTPKPMHPVWLSDDNQAVSEPTGVDPEWTAMVAAGERGGDDGMAAVCEAYSLGLARGVDRVTPEIARVLKALEAMERERDQYREHSITLNSVTFAIAEALGLVPPGADCAQGDPVDLARRLIGSLERRTAQLDEANAEVERLRAEVDIFGPETAIS